MNGIYREKAGRGREFILMKKTAKHQVKRIINFLEKE